VAPIWISHAAGGAPVGQSECEASREPNRNLVALKLSLKLGSLIVAKLGTSMPFTEKALPR
jgi:hypothetical protein